MNSFNNQVVTFYHYSVSDSSLKVFREIADEAGLERLSDKSRLQSSQGYTAADARFEEMCFYAPKTAPLFVLGDTVVIINETEGKIEFYDLDGTPAGETSLQFKHRRMGDSRYFQDRATGRIYTRFTRHDLMTVARLDLSSGTIAASWEVPAMPFIESPLIHCNRLYFLYDAKENPGYKQLFSMALQQPFSLASGAVP